MPRIFYLGLFGLSLTPALALAQSPTLEQQRREQAQRLFFTAEEEYAKGNYEAALSGYDQAYILTQEPLLLFNQAQCYRQLKRYQEALDTYQLFVEKMPDERTFAPKAREWLATIQQETGLSPRSPIQPATTKPADNTAPTSLPKDISPKVTPSKETTKNSQKLLYVSAGAGAAWVILSVSALSAAGNARDLQLTPIDVGDEEEAAQALAEKQRRARTLGTLSDVALFGAAASFAGYLYFQRNEKLSATVTTQSISLTVRF
jgi:tetratricopeptide (TPR) repeat protein